MGGLAFERGGPAAQVPLIAVHLAVLVQFELLGPSSCCLLRQNAIHHLPILVVFEHFGRGPSSNLHNGRLVRALSLIFFVLEKADLLDGLRLRTRGLRWLVRHG